MSPDLIEQALDRIEARMHEVGEDVRALQVHQDQHAGAISRLHACVQALEAQANRRAGFLAGAAATAALLGAGAAWIWDHVIMRLFIAPQ